VAKLLRPKFSSPIMKMARPARPHGAHTAELPFSLPDLPESDGRERKREKLGDLAGLEAHLNQPLRPEDRLLARQLVLRKGLAETANILNDLKRKEGKEGKQP
jgi:hypothetical protein